MTPTADKIAEVADLVATGLAIGAAVSSETVIGGISLGALALGAKGISGIASAYSAFQNYEAGNPRRAAGTLASSVVGTFGGAPASMIAGAATARGVKLAMGPAGVKAMSEANGYVGGKLTGLAICP